MRFHELFLNEARHETVAIGEDEVDVLFDPIAAEFATMLNRSRGRLRGFLDDGHLCVWPASEATHHQMERALGIADPDYRLTLRDDRVLLDVPPDDVVRNSAALIRAYGGQSFEIRGGV